MGGQNPYIQEPDVSMPTRKYRVTFQPMNVEVDVDPEKLPYGHDGLPGSLLDVALGADIDIDHACGGVCACSTCHVLVKRGEQSLNEALEEEDDMLENAPGLKPSSRLACQAVPDGSCDLVVEIPDWNRNLIKEEH
ncbi:MAG: 2Fe-2S iron-sulfur cluster binding domain-containing protein [bacterium]|nr:2Fe-2S iron-sulfur cluster binding domain-containing protein [bacterium]